MEVLMPTLRMILISSLSLMTRPVEMLRRFFFFFPYNQSLIISLDMIFTNGNTTTAHAPSAPPLFHTSQSTVRPSLIHTWRISKSLEVSDGTLW